jgi:hypothetical protein
MNTILTVTAQGRLICNFLSNDSVARCEYAKCASAGERLLQQELILNVFLQNRRW